MAGCNQVDGWQTYTNSEYGFKIQYPPKYKTVVDTYGWPNSVVHFMDRAQGAESYRATISVWDNQDDYGKSTVYSGMKYEINKAGNKYIVISYSAGKNADALISEWQNIISSFKVIVTK